MFWNKKEAKPLSEIPKSSFYIKRDIYNSDDEKESQLIFILKEKHYFISTFTNELVDQVFNRGCFFTEEKAREAYKHLVVGDIQI